MTLLILFAALAGAATALTPCVLPVLPALLSASATGGRRRPLGVVIGLTASHTLVIVALGTLVSRVGLADGFVRTFAIVVLLFFGLSLILPRLGEKVEAPLSRLSRFGPRSAGSGFWSGIGVGAALGFVYAPCAGPIVAAIISVGATQDSSLGLVAVALAYGAGSALSLGLMAFGGRRMLERLRRTGRGPGLQRAVGVVMVVTALAMFANLDVRFTTALANDFPAFLTNPTRGLEDSDAVEERLADLRGESRFDSDRDPVAAANPHIADPASRYPVLGDAPGFTGNQEWFNTPDGRGLSLEELRGRVVLVDFWTYTCINCIRTFPALKEWDRLYRDKGLTIVGVHTPEFAFERKASNVREAIDQNGLAYPVAQDNDYATWNAWGNQFWPAKYLIDAQGRVRYTHFGEGDYEQTEQAIRALLEESGQDRLGGLAEARTETADPAVRTPETYLGTERAAGWVGEEPRNGTRSYPGADRLPPNGFALTGEWRVDGESATSGEGASLDARFKARKVFLVMSSDGGRARDVQVLLDGEPVSAARAGEDVRGGTATVGAERLYRLVSLPRAGEHQLRLRFPPGVRGYAFTFG
ncbi:MAG: cytochrome c biogenesis protein DipZ [Actinomycetota bacterium]|nr:cytochrome c biogenesis protein DipZ [Actinomycetota bacterium]